MNSHKSFNPAIRDAFYKAENGKTLVHQAKKYVFNRQVAGRVRQLKELVYFACQQYNRLDLYHELPEIRDSIRKLAVQGDQRYDASVMAFKYAPEKRENFSRAIQDLIAK